MMNTEELKFYKKANTLEEVDNAVRLDVPINATHKFFTNFTEVRGEFEEKVFYKALNVNVKNKKYTFNPEINKRNKQTIFLAGMRGSGKTTEIAKYVDKLHNPQCFFCVVCNLDDQEKGLDLNDMEYMDILIFQIERLITELEDKGVELENNILEILKNWFEQRVEEVNKVIKEEHGFELEVKASTPNFLSSFFKITSKLKSNLKDNKENAQTIRTVLKNNFTEFAKKLNLFLEYVNVELRKQNIAQELLFIIDGLEKTASMDIREKIIIKENNRFRQIKAYTIFTLPIELMDKKPFLESGGFHVNMFPFVKLQKRNGEYIDKAIAKFEEFIYKRIDEELFESKDVVKKAIFYSGGSPRELLRILEYASIYADENLGKITLDAMNKVIKKRASETAQYLLEEDFKILKILKENNEQGIQTVFSEEFKKLMESGIVMEYNDGTYKRVNPVVAKSELYKQYVG